MAAEGATAITRQPSLEERRLQFQAHQAFVRHEQDRLNQRHGQLDQRIAQLQRQKDDLESERDHDLELCVATRAVFQVTNAEQVDRMCFSRALGTHDARFV